VRQQLGRRRTISVKRAKCRVSDEKMGLEKIFSKILFFS
jgi:hypothetical protein